MDYRRELSRKEQLATLGAGVAAGVAGAYLARVLLQRTPLHLAADAPPGGVPDVAATVRAERRGSAS
ncbi:hypothetical protein BH20GEM2_BH20GEM2_04150 [soil metagenome]